MSEQPEKGFESLFQQDREEEQAERTEERAEPKALAELPQTKLSRLEKLERKKAQLEHQIKAIHARENEKVRRARTRRLIQIGALACKYLNCPMIFRRVILRHL